jgi:hypothetical protein
MGLTGDGPAIVDWGIGTPFERAAVENNSPVLILLNTDMGQPNTGQNVGTRARSNSQRRFYHLRDIARRQPENRASWNR